MIDPVLSYSTFLGGSLNDEGDDIAVGADGAVYITGGASSADFPTIGALQPTLSGSFDAFVAKFTPDGTALVYATYLGGGDADGGRGIAVDAAGAAFVTGGTTSSDFPIVNPVQPRYGGGEQDVFVVKLTPDGTALVYATYLGGRGEEGASGIAVDSVGAAYVTGDTTSPDFPTVNALQPASGGGICGSLLCPDGFVAKLTPNGIALVYATYLGGSGFDRGFDIAIDASGAASRYWTNAIGQLPHFTSPTANTRGNRGCLCREAHR